MWWLSDFFDLLEAAFWPFVLLIIFLCLKKDIRAFIQNIETLKHGDTKIEISKALNNIEQDIKLSSDNASLITSEKLRDEMKLAREDANTLLNQYINPKIVIIESWISFEKTLRDIIDYKFNNESALGNLYLMNSPAHRLIENLVASEDLSSEDARIIHKIRKIRNEVVHTNNVNVTAEEALQFAEILSAISLQLRHKFNIS